jgi:hypothetical protein
VDEVQIGEDGWLFLTGGSNHALRYYTDPNYFTDEHADRWVNLLERRHAAFSDCDVKYFHVFAADKLSVYPEKFGQALPNLHRHPIRLVTNRWDECGLPPVLINPLDMMLGHPSKDKFYLKTDTHWTLHAGLLVLQSVFDKLGVNRTATLEGRDISRYSLAWDLGSKLEARCLKKICILSHLRLFAVSGKILLRRCFRTT